MARNKQTAALIELLRAAGYDPEVEPIHPRTLHEAQTLIAEAGDDPKRAIARALAAQRELAHARRQCAAAAESASKLKGILDGLLEADSVLCRVRRIDTGREGAPVVLCEFGNQLCELRVHPDVALDTLDRLQPWHYVRVHPTERVAIGTCDEPELFAEAHGAVVAFKGYQDFARGLVRVRRDGHDEEIVTLADELRGERLEAPTSLVLQRGHEQLAIARAVTESPESRFELPIEQIETTLDDLAGLDEIVEPLIEDILLRLVRPDIRREFGLLPLGGALLYSYAPGQGKTALMRAIARFLHDLGKENDFDVVLYVVKPNELKIVWHGGDAKLVREDLCGSIAARQAQPRTRPLFQIVLLDEIDSLGRRVGGDDPGAASSPAHNDAIQALLAEMDGIAQRRSDAASTPAHVLWVGLTNRPDMVDPALKRPGRFGDLVREMPSVTLESAEAIMAVYARGAELPWFVDGEICRDLAPNDVRERLLRPALATVFASVVLRYATDRRDGVPVTAGQVFAGVHLMHAMNGAKRRAARRSLYGEGVAAIGTHDVVEGLLEQACDAAAQMQADRLLMVRQLKLRTRPTRVDTIPRDELGAHSYVQDLTA